MTFEIIPSITVAYGRVVGDYSPLLGAASGSNPLAWAWYWISRGAQHLHIEDAGSAVSMPTVPALLLGCGKAASLGIAGRIQDAPTAQFLASQGATSLVLRSGRGISNVEAVLQAIPPERWMFEVDLEEAFDPPVVEKLRMAKAIGADRVLLRGSWTAPRIFPYQVDAIRSLKERGHTIWVSGGIRHRETVQSLKEWGVSGAIIGRALNQGILSFTELTS